MTLIAKLLLALTIVTVPVTSMSGDAFAQRAGTSNPGGSSGGGGNDPNRDRYPRCTPSMVIAGYECRGVAESDCSCKEYVVQLRNGRLERRQQCHEFVGNPMEKKVSEIKMCEDHLRNR